MNLRSCVRLLAPCVAALGLAGGASAADTPPPLRVYEPGVPAVGVACPTCGQEATPGPSCKSCGKSPHYLKHCKPYNVQLRPGACFGYFQTQWHRWEDVCPLPYQGVGLTDAPRPPTPSLGPTTPPVRPVDPKDVKPMDPNPPKKGNELPPKPGGDLPGVPSVPGTLPIPPKSGGN